MRTIVGRIILAAIRAAGRLLWWLWLLVQRLRGKAGDL